MDSELARKRPANVQAERVPNVRRLPRTDYLEGTFHERQALVARVHKMARRGEIGPTYRIRSTERGWAVQVVRLAEPRSPWRKRGLVLLGVVAAAGVLLWLLALALQALATALVAILPALLGVLGAVALLGLLASLAGGGGGGSAVQNNYFR